MKISVIIPVYNVNKYLDRCIRSLSEQTYKDIEIILVDDGSTDGSGSICDDWAVRDSRIVVVHQVNKGLSAARNIGLERTSGEYILFVDSDDFVDRKFVSLLADEACKRNSDIVFCNYRFVDDSGNEINNDNYSSFSSEKVYDGTDVLELFEDKSYRTFFDVCWNKLYRKELFDGVRFPEGISVIEDISIVPLIYHKAERISVVKDVLYNYVYRAESLSHSQMSIEEDTRLRAPMMEERLQWYKEWGNKELCLIQIIHMYSLYEKVAHEYRERMKKLQKEYRSIFLLGKCDGMSRKIYYEKSIQGSRKLKLSIAYLSLKLYSVLTKIM